jgi:hypothetical protein
MRTEALLRPAGLECAAWLGLWGQILGATQRDVEGMSLRKILAPASGGTVLTERSSFHSRYGPMPSQPALFGLFLASTFQNSIPMAASCLQCRRWF